MKHYLTVLKKDWYRNEFAVILAVLALSLFTVYVAVAVYSQTVNGVTVQFTNFWALFLPSFLLFVAVVHFFTRPAVLIAYKQR